MPLFLHSADWQIGKPYARVHDPDKRARLRQVRLGTASGERVEVLSGVSAGDQVATDPQTAARAR